MTLGPRYPVIGRVSESDYAPGRLTPEAVAEALLPLVEQGLGAVDGASGGLLRTAEPAETILRGQLPRGETPCATASPRS